MIPSSLRFGALALGLLFPFSGAVAQDELLISGFFSNAVHRYDAATGASLGSIGPIAQPMGIAFDDAGFLYIVSEGTNRVLRYDATSLALLGEFIVDDPATPLDETGGLVNPTGIAFGPDGAIYVASFATDAIHRFDARTGAFLGLFVAAGSGGLDGPDAGIAFGPDGHLYVPSYNNDRVLRYDGRTGAFLGTFVAAGAGGLQRPRTLRFRSDGHLLVSSETTGQILRYARNGASMGAFATPHAGITGFALSPVGNHLVSTSLAQNNVQLWDGGSGARIRRLVAQGAGGLQGAVFLAARPTREVVLSRLEPGIAGQVNALELRHLTPSAPFALLFGTAGASVLLPGCGAAFLGIAQPELYPARADASGRFRLQAPVDPLLQGLSLHLQAFDASCKFSNLVVETLR
ncbi:MAG: NHL repeat-containing protein [Planctomycetes bacterium]|nr:NHL repeat-containing protein [Planctomycetota bacterium]